MYEIINGISGKLAARGSVTCAQIAAMFMRYSESVKQTTQQRGGASAPLHLSIHGNIGAFVRIDSAAVIPYNKCRKRVFSVGRLDAESKAYMSDAVHFADAFNYLIYDGKPVIRPSELTPLDTVELAIPYGNDERAPEQKYRDVLKLWQAMRDDKAVYAVLGVENQSHVHYAMPVRDGLYDFIHYAKQVEEAKSKARESESPLTNAEFLSGLRKGDKLLPVVTLVVFFGASEWDGPMSLHEMLDCEDKYLLRLIPDYRINLIAPARMRDEEFLKFQSDFGKVLEYIKYSKDKNKLNQLVHDGDRYRSMEPESAALINAATGTELKLTVKEGKVDMCQAIEDMKKESEARGILKTLGGLVADGLLSLTEAAKRANMSVLEFEASVSKLQANQ